MESSKTEKQFKMHYILLADLFTSPSALMGTWCFHNIRILQAVKYAAKLFIQLKTKTTKQSNVKYNQSTI